jgi:hypothetical protein
VGAGNYTIAHDPKCLGFQGDKKWTLKEWNENQGADIYHEMEALFKEITLNKKLLNERLHNENLLKMFFMVYDLDKFKRFVFESKFLDVFDIEKEVVKRIKEDEEELLKFAFRWLKFGLVDKDALKVKRGEPFG